VTLRTFAKSLTAALAYSTSPDKYSESR